MSDEFLSHLPQQWVGLAAIIMFGLYVSLQVIEKSPAIAKVFPLGTWWHKRQKGKASHRANRVDEAIEDNKVILEMQRQQEALASTSQAQGLVIAGMEETLRAHVAFSIYDSGWHHRHDSDNAGTTGCQAAHHHDFFEFERIWRTDPLTAARLSEA